MRLFGKTAEDDYAHHEIAGISFNNYSSKEIKAMSVKKITNPVIFDELNHPAANGLYDRALGPFEQGDV